MIYLASEFEYGYMALIERIWREGTVKEGRNGSTRSLFGQSFTIDMRDTDHFPILQGRKMYPQGVKGEMAAMFRGPQSVDDFEKWGCNYWDQWADEEGLLNLDYGNAWINFNGVDQMAQVAETLKTNPNDRRMLVTGWRPELIDHLSLPCCHLLYQWRVDGGYLDMIWFQRSVDSMVGLPSNIMMAAIWNILLANETGFKPGRITYMLGDTHIYEVHEEPMKQYLAYGQNYILKQDTPKYVLNAPAGQPVNQFVPDDLDIQFTPGPRLKLEVLA